MKDVSKFTVVNKSLRKIDASALSQGKKLFAGDLAPENCLYVKMLWSPHAHANIKKIDISKAEKMPGVKLVLYHGNVPRIPHCTAGQGYPEPSPYDTFIFDKKVRFVGDRVAAVIAETQEQAAEALKVIEVEYELLKPVFSFDEALADGAPVIHDEKEAYVPLPIPYEPKKNIVAKVGAKAGDFEKGIKEADYIFDETFETSYAQHCPIEGYIAWAQMDPYNRVVITTSTQVPFHARRILARALDIPVQKIRVIKPRIGGGFGCKQEMMVDDIVALGALRTGRPVLWALTRDEVFRSGRTRHPMRIRVKYGVKKSGDITAMGLYVINNTGAYGGHGLTVASCSGRHIIPLYHVNNIEFDAKVIYTNLPVGGAYRGFGATQAAFPTESMIDVIAEKIGMDPLEFRKRNHIKVGEGHPLFEALGEGKPGKAMTIGSSGLPECIEKGAKEIGWEKRRPHTEKTGRFRRGIGMSIHMQGSGIPEIDMASASIKMNDDGSFNLLMGATDLGTGSDTILAQIAAEEIGTSLDKIIVYSSDTDLTPFDCGAYATKTTYIAGNAVKKTAAKVKEQILKVGAEILSKKAEELDTCDGQVVALDGSCKVPFSEIAHHATYLSNQFLISAIESHVAHKSPPPFCANFAEVEVDMETGHVKVIKYVCVVDCGIPINPKLCEGQAAGGLLNAISYALTEEYRFDQAGKMTNANFMTYNIFSMRDIPEIKVMLVPAYEETGPFGAKAVGEITMNGMPAIANAIYNACGARMKKAPFTQERVWRAIQDLKK